MSIAVSQGAHTFYVRATDAVGTTTANDDLESDLFTIDTGGPTISISALSPDLNGDNTPTFTGTASDIFSTVNAVSYQIDSTIGSWSACTPNDSLFNSSSEVYNCTTTSLSDGSHTIYTRATDNLSNTTSLASYAQDTFTIDTNPPSTPGTPSAITSSDDSTPTWNWTESTDSGSGLSPSSAYTLQWSTSLDFSSGVSTGTIGTSSCSAGICSYTHSVNLSNAIWYFRVKATDLFGRESSYSTNGSISISANSDTQAPNGSISINIGNNVNPKYTNIKNATLIITANDDISSTENLLMMISDNSTFTNASWENFASSKDITLSNANGTQTFYAKFKDDNNNQSDSVFDTIIYDTIAPNAPKLKTPKNQTTTPDNKPTFEFKKSEDTQSGINYYQLIIDDKTMVNNISPTTPGESDNHIRESSQATMEYDGSYIKVTPKTTLSEGKHTWKIRVYDNAENAENSSVWKILIDTNKPNLQLSQIGETKKKITPTSNSDNIFITTKRNPEFIGIAEANALIKIKIVDHSICETKADNNGNWSCTPNENLNTNIRYRIEISAYDEMKNETILPDIYLIRTEYNYSTEIIKIEETPNDQITKTATHKSSDNDYNLTIKVVDQNTNPIQNIKITVFSEPKEAFTNEKGEVYFAEMPEGKHNIIIEYEDGSGEQGIELVGENKNIRYEIMIIKTSETPTWIWSLITLSILIIGFLSYKLYKSKKES